jgi:hypothetical protein
VLEHASDDLPLPFKLWFGNAFNLARDITSIKASRIASKTTSLKRNLWRVAPPRPDAISHASCSPKQAPHLTDFLEPRIRLSYSGNRKVVEKIEKHNFLAAMLLVFPTWPCSKV